MPDISSTVLNDAIALAGSSKVNAFENRLSDYQAYAAFEKYAGDLLNKSTIEQIKMSARQPVKVPVLNKQAGSIITTRSCTIPSPDKDSAFLTLTWATVGFAVGIKRSVHTDNYITAEESLADQFKDGIKAVFADLDTSAVTALEAGKTATFPFSKYTDDGTKYTPTALQSDEFYRNVPALMKRHDLSGLPFIDIANTEAETTERFLQAQGAANSVNEAYAFNNEVAKYDFFRSNRVTPDLGDTEVHYLAAPGSIGTYNWIDIDSRANNKIHDGKFWTTMTDPIMGHEWGVYYVKDCADLSGELLGLNASMQEAWMFTKDVAFVTAYHSDTDRSIVKVGIL